MVRKTMFTNTERKTMFTNISPCLDLHCPQSNSDILSTILNSDNKFVIYEFGKFLKYAFNKRKTESKESVKV